MSKVFHVGGAKGVGKTVILSELNGATSPMGYKIRTLHVSELLEKISQDTFGKAWKSLRDEQRCNSRIKLIDIVKETESPVILLDSHLIDMRGNDPKLILPSEFEPLIDGFMVMTAPIDTIRAQRFGDLETRERDMDPDLIYIEDEAEYRAALLYSKKIGLNIHLIENKWKPDTKNDILKGVDLFMTNQKSIEGNNVGYEGNSIHNIERK